MAFLIHHSSFTIFLMVIAVSAVGGEDVAVDSARQQDPRIELPSPRAVFSPKLKPLWLSALSAREEDLKRQAAQTIALAPRRGMPQLAAPAWCPAGAPGGFQAGRRGGARHVATGRAGTGRLGLSADPQGMARPLVIGRP